MMNAILGNLNKVIAGFVILAALVAFFVLRSDNTILIRIPGIEQATAYTLREGSYAMFLSNHEHVPPGTHTVYVDLFNPTDGHGFFVKYGFMGEERVLYTEEESEITFEIYLSAAGMFNVFLEYFPVESRGIDITREIRINGEVPFTGAELVVFRRVWGCSDVGVRIDTQGNEIRPPQIERPRWEFDFFRDRLGFYPEPYQFFLDAGLNTVTIVGHNEPMAIRSLSLIPVRRMPTFAEFIRETNLQPVTDDFQVRIQGQHSTVRSAPSLFPLFDNSSSITEPSSPSLIVLNMIGGEPWRLPGQWIEWEVYAPRAGLYRISISARQSYNRGFVSSRAVMVNGVIPFAEAAAVPFGFNNSWDIKTLTDAYGNDLLFPFNAGLNTIRMEVTLGELGVLIDRLLDSVYRLNEAYRQILVLTGPTPDSLRDYRVHYWLPEVMVALHHEIGILYRLHEDLVEVFGDRNEHTGLIASMLRRLQTFYTRPERIPIELVSFRIGVTAMGDAARVLTEGQLDVNFIIVSGTGAEIPVIRETFFARAWHEMRAFAASFTMDFDSVGDVYHGDDVIYVWIPSGRDQAMVFKSMIDDTFIPQTGIRVNMRLVDGGAILPAVVAGIAPDLVVSIGLPDPVNFAMRNAVVDLTTFPDFHEVRQRFAESAMVPFEFQGGYYALPETQVFNVMFYRRDILAELGVELPNTWDDVQALMPILQRNNMFIGIPAVGDPLAPNLGGFLTQLYQRDGFLFNEEHSRTILDSEEALAAFEAYTRFFTHLGSPQAYDFNNRFRSGEMPIGFADFTNFNVLSVFAPEIMGQWGFALMPGIEEPDGTINRMVPAGGAATVIFRQSQNQDLAWEFLKWWTSAEAQLRFARELESIMGAAARFPTANIEAFSRLPWSTSDMQVINAQREWTLGTPEVPGGYYVHRHLLNAIRRVINQNVDTRETLLDFNIVINRELINKRREFGLE